MIKKIVFGAFWLVALNVAAGLLIAAVVGLMAGGDEADPQKAYEAGRAAGASVAWVMPYVFVGLTLFVSFGTAKGFLPGTRTPERQGHRRNGS